MLSLMRLDDVTDATTLMEFTREKFGCPSFKKDEMLFRAQCKNWFKQNPEYTYRDMAKVVLWAKEVRKRPRYLHTIFHYASDAFAAGVLPPRAQHERERITAAMYAALDVETDPEWRFRLSAAATPGARRDVIQEWEAERGPHVHTPDRAREISVEQDSLFA